MLGCHRDSIGAFGNAQAGRGMTVIDGEHGRLLALAGVGGNGAAAGEIAAARQVNRARNFPLEDVAELALGRVRRHLRRPRGRPQHAEDN